MPCLHFVVSVPHEFGSPLAQVAVPLLELRVLAHEVLAVLGGAVVHTHGAVHLACLPGHVEANLCGTAEWHVAKLQPGHVLQGCNSDGAEASSVPLLGLELSV